MTQEQFIAEVKEELKLNAVQGYTFHRSICETVYFGANSENSENSYAVVVIVHDYKGRMCYYTFYKYSTMDYVAHSEHKELSDAHAAMIDLFD